MSKQSEYLKLLEIEKKRIDENYQQILSSIFDANIVDNSHNMLIGEEITKIFDDLSFFNEFLLLEKVELWDFWNYDRNGWSNTER